MVVGRSGDKRTQSCRYQTCVAARVQHCTLGLGADGLLPASASGFPVGFSFGLAAADWGCSAFDFAAAVSSPPSAAAASACLCCSSASALTSGGSPASQSTTALHGLSISLRYYVGATVRTITWWGRGSGARDKI